MLDGCACVEIGVRYAHSIGTGKRDESLTVITGTCLQSVWSNYSLLHLLTDALKSAITIASLTQQITSHF